jgi:molecular chaperone DnaK (HSP70)
MASFGVDFGTTNSLLSLIRGNEVIALTNGSDDLPHPSVVGYVGNRPLVGREAKSRVQRPDIGVIGDFVRSPKGYLGTGREIHVAGKGRAAKDVCAEIFKYLREDALARKFPGESFDRAIVTIPVAMRGRARRELRDAALQAGIHVVQFVHEPLAALYGFLHRHKDFQRELAKLQDKLVLVFDWGGGTLDLTFCRVHDGTLVQIANEGTNKVGGDKFDERLMRFAREKHVQRHGLTDLSAESADAEAKLLAQCELAKIALSRKDTHTLFVKDFLQVDNTARNLEVTVRRADLEEITKDLVDEGMECINRILGRISISREAVSLCLATGGMVQMPIIAERLRERFGVSRLPSVEHADRLISEGAAWIAHDGLRLRLSKPFEVLQAANTYIPIFHADVTLPQEGQHLPANMGLYCVDPRDGFAKFQFARPSEPDRSLPGDRREIYDVLTVNVDQKADPFFERLEVKVDIDHDLIATVTAKSTLVGEEKKVEIHDLEFGLGLATPQSESKATPRPSSRPDTKADAEGIVQMRSNVSKEKDWGLIPGELMSKYAFRPIDGTSWQAKERQKLEQRYYALCSYCKRNGYQIEKAGCLVPCRKEHLQSVSRPNT